MAKLPSQEAAALAYAEVHTLVSYVHKKVGNRGLRTLLSAQRQGKGSRKAVAEAMDMHWDEVEKGWKRYLKSSKFKTSSALAHRTERIRFRKGEGSDDNVGLDAIKNVKARKYTRLAGMLRARGLSAAAAVEYEKAIAITGKGDPFVAGKLSRTYLELGRFDEAIALAEPLLSLEEVDSLPATTVGVAYLSKGEAKRSVAPLEAALSINPFDPTVRCSLARAYTDTGDTRSQREENACQLLR
jgi:predicted Zn-dependent protease